MNYVKIIFKCAVAFMFSAVFFFGCGPSKDEVFEKFTYVEKKTKEITVKASKVELIPGRGYDVLLPLNGPGFNEKYEYMKFKMDAAKLAFEKSNYNMTLKLLQEADDAANWIIEKHPQWSKARNELGRINIALQWLNLQLQKYDPEQYDQGVKYRQLGDEAYRKCDFQGAAVHYNKAANIFINIKTKFENLTSTLASRKKQNNNLQGQVDLLDAKRLASELYQQAVAKAQAAVSAEKEMLFDKSIQLFDESDAIYNRISKEVTPEVIIKDMMASFVKVEPGSFDRTVIKSFYYGAPQGEMTQKVILTEAFFINKYEVTQAQFYAVMKYLPDGLINYGPNKGADKPILDISLENAMEFCDKLNKDGYAPEGWKITLPTECQWEFAARGGNKSRGYKFSGSNDLHEVTSVEKLSPVGSKKPNELGLYDMTGNVTEFCLDWYGRCLGKFCDYSDKELVDWMQTDQHYKYDPFYNKHVVRGQNCTGGHYMEYRDRNKYLLSKDRSCADRAGFRLVLVQQD